MKCSSVVPRKMSYNTVIYQAWYLYLEKIQSHIKEDLISLAVFSINLY